MKRKRMSIICAVCVMLVTVMSPVIGYAEKPSGSKKEVHTFEDAEGLENKMVLWLEEDGTCCVEYYIEDVLCNYSESSVEGDIVTAICRDANGEVHTYTKEASSIVAIGGADNESTRVAKGVTFQVGTIYYNANNYSLKVYFEDTGYSKYPINIDAEKNMSVGVLTSMVGSLLGDIFVGLAAAAGVLIPAAVAYAGSAIVGGLIAIPFSTTCLARQQNYNVKYTYPVSGRTITKTGAQYVVLLEDGETYGTDIYSKNYCKWKDPTMCHNIYAAFWGEGSYPGVSHIVEIE